jgi:mRNA-degrading endonuclease YafQ of YafQ-DinJ toxin-antitoxin module
MKKLFWRIRGHDGFKDTFDKTVALGQFSDEQMKHLLRALTAKAGLSDHEIVGAYAKRKTKIANDLLEVHRDFRYPTYMCGHGPVFTASVVDEHRKITRHPTL